MMEPRLIELINAEIDGVNTDDETRELQAYLEGDAGARQYKEALAAIVAAVESVPTRPVPHALEKRILEAVPFGHPPHAGAGRRVARWFDAWLPTPRLRYAAAVAVGILVGGVLFAGLSGLRGGRGESNLWGTMRTIDEADGFRELGATGIDLEDVKGQVRLHESGGTLLAEVSLQSGAEIDWVLQYDPDDLNFEGFRQLGQGTPKIASNGSETRLHHTGENKYHLFFTEKEGRVAPLKVKIFSSQGLLYENQIVPSPGG
jgi:hypothetical protein